MNMISKQAADKALEIYQDELLDTYPEFHRLSVTQKDNSEEYAIEAGLNDVQAFETNPRNVSYPKTLSLSMSEVDSLDAGTEPMEVEFILINEVPPTTSDLEQDVITLHQVMHRPIAGGDSIGNDRFRSAGTLGSAVTLNGNEGFFITNYHVLKSNSGVIGDSVLQPGRLDGGKTRDKVATLFSSTLSPYVDMAIARMNKKIWLSNTIRRIGFISGVEVNAPVGTPVQKSGRTTNLTTGQVLSVNTTVRVNGSSYPNGSAVFKNQIMTSKMLEAGDSGSILLTASNKVIGLCFAGSSTRSYANPIKEVIGAVCILIKIF